MLPQVLQRQSLRLLQRHAHLECGPLLAPVQRQALLLAVRPALAPEAQLLLWRHGQLSRVQQGHLGPARRWQGGPTGAGCRGPLAVAHEKQQAPLLQTMEASIPGRAQQRCHAEHQHQPAVEAAGQPRHAWAAAAAAVLEAQQPAWQQHLQGVPRWQHHCPQQQHGQAEAEPHGLQPLQVAQHVLALAPSLLLP